MSLNKLKIFVLVSSIKGNTGIMVILVVIPKVDKTPRALNLSITFGAPGSIFLAASSFDVVIVIATDA